MVKTPEGWIETTLKEIIDTIIDNRGKNPDYYVESGIPVIDNVLIKDNRQINLNEAKRFIDDYIYNNFIRKYNQPGDVIMTLVGNGYGNISLFPNKKSVIIQNTIGLRTNHQSINLFVYYLLKYKKREILELDIGAAQPSIKVGDLLSINITLPPLPEQKAIAGVLSSFDDKIELLRAENQTLEEMGQTLFKEWFGKYKVGDKLPDGWKVGKLGKVVDHIKINIVPGKEPEKIFSHYSLPAFDEGQKPSKEKGELIMSNKYKVLDKCIPISKLNPFFPRIRTIFEPENNAVCSTEFQVLKARKEIYFSYCHCLLNSQKFTDDISKKVQGTSSSHQRVKPDDILNSEIIIGDEKSINSFNEKFYPMLEKIENNKKQIEILSKTRDQLLPKLMSGEVRVGI